MSEDGLRRPVQLRGLYLMAAAGIVVINFASILALSLNLQAPAEPAAPQEQTTISGTVVDTAGAPISAARVRIVELRREDASRVDGSFTLAGVPAGSHTLEVLRIGFRPVRETVTVGQSPLTGLRIVMTPAIIQLATMVVTGTVSERAISEVISPITVVDGEQLARKLAATVAATLQREPGVAVAGMGPATARIVIRGLGGDRVVMLEDGERAGDLSATSPDHAVSIDPLTATQFEVTRGPMSLLYGSSALGGVVNVIRDEIPTTLSSHLHGTFSLEGASANRGLSAGGHAVTSVGRFALRGEATVRNSSDLRTPVGELDNTEARTYNAGAGGSYIYESGHVGGSYRFYGSRYGIPGGFVGGHESGVDIEMRRHSAKLVHDHNLESGPFTNVNSSAAFTDYYHAEKQPAGGVSTAFDQRFMSADILARHDELGVLEHGAVGVRWQYRDITTRGALKTPSTRDYSFALFMVEEWEVRQLHAQLGARYDWARYEPLEEAFVQVGGEDIPARPRTFGSFSASAGLMLHATESLQLGTSISRAFRTPDFNELYSDGPHLAAFSYDVGNPRLGQETGVGIDVFARISRERLSAEATWFRNRMSGFVFPRNTGEIGPQGGRPKFQFVGKDAVLTGAEGALAWNVLPLIVIEGNISWVRGALAGMPDSIPAIGDEPARAGSRYLPLIPPLHGSAGLRYQRSRFFAGIEGRFAARQDRLGDFETVTTGYGTLNGSAGVQFSAAGRSHALTLRFDNITNREVRDHLSRVKDVMPEAGRNLSFLYRVSF